MFNKICDETQKYTYKYRLIKTLLLISAWISFALSNELVGPTLEDLRVVLHLSYNEISRGLVFRSIGYLTFTFSSGLVLDRFSNYAEIIMAVTCVFRSLRKI